MLTTLFGKSIWILRQNLPNKLMSPGCATRIAVHTLYQIKQIHEVGFILRDLKIGLFYIYNELIWYKQSIISDGCFNN